MMEILTILIVIFVIAVLWTLLKTAFKLTAKVFSCGIMLILLIGLTLLALRVLELPAL